MGRWIYPVSMSELFCLACTFVVLEIETTKTQPMSQFEKCKQRWEMFKIKCKQFYWRYVLFCFLPLAGQAQESQKFQFIDQALFYELSHANVDCISIKSMSNTIFESDSTDKRTEYLIYDFERKNYVMSSNYKKSRSKTSTKPLKMTKNQALGVLVLNMNPLKYQAEVSTSVFNYNREMNTELAALISPATTNTESSDKILGKPEETEKAVEADSIEAIKRERLEGFKVLNQELEILFSTVSNLDILNAAVYSQLLIELNGNIARKFEEYASIYSLGSAIKNEHEDSAEVEVLVNQSLNIYNKLTQIRPYQFFDAVSPDENDQLLVDLTIKQKEPNVDPTNYKVIRNGSDSPIRVNVSGGLKIDGSGGLFITSLIDHNFKNVAETYQDTTFFTTADFQITDSITAISEESRNRIERDDNGRFDISAGALVHFYIRNSRTVNYGVSLGATINTQQTLRYLLGASLLVGRKQRVSLSGGAAFGKVKRLATGLQEGQVYTGDASTAFREVNEVGYFFGLSYNF